MFISKLSAEMIDSLEKGNLEIFRQFLINKEIKTITLNHDPKLFAINHHIFSINLGQALQGTQVTTLSLICFNIGQYAPLFAKALQGSLVNKLYLSSNNIGEHAHALVQALKGTKVTKLLLTCNHIGEHAPLLAQALQGSKIDTLELSHNNIAQYAPLFVHALYNSKINTLGLGGNHIAQYAPLLAHALKDTQVTSLNLISNNIAKHTVEFAQALSGTKVTKLILGNNCVEPHVIELIQALQNTKVDSLALSRTRIFQINLVAQALTHTSIKRLKVGKIFVNKENRKKLQQVTLENCRRDYIQRLLLAEQQGSSLAKLYQEAFTDIKLSFPVRLARLIAKFLDYGEDKNLENRFLNGLKKTCFSTCKQ